MCAAASRLRRLWRRVSLFDIVTLAFEQDLATSARPPTSVDNQNASCANPGNFTDLALTQKQATPIQNGDRWVMTECSKRVPCMNQQDVLSSEPLSLAGQPMNQSNPTCTNQTGQQKQAVKAGIASRAVLYLCEEDDVRPTVDLCMSQRISKRYPSLQTACC